LSGGGRKHGRAATVLLLLLALPAAWVVAHHGETWFRQLDSFDWNIKWEYLLLSTVILVVSYRFTPVGWTILAKRAGSDTSAPGLRRAWFTSQLGRYLPGKVWLFAGRAAFLKGKGLSGYRSTMVPFLELLYTAAGAGLATVPAALLSGGTSFTGPAMKAVAAAGISILVIPFLRPIQRKLYAFKYGKSPDDLPLPDRATSLRLLLLYALLWWTRGIVLYLWLLGFGIPGVGFFTCLAAAPVSWLAGYVIFLVPGGIGVREAVLTAMVAPAGYTGPVLVAAGGQRLILSLVELSFALTGTTGTTGVPDTGGGADDSGDP